MLTTSNGTPVLVQKNRRARYIKLYVNNKREVKLTLPWFVPLSAGRAILREKEQWLENALAKLPPKIERSPAEIQQLKQKSFDRVSALAEKYAVCYGVHFRHIHIGNQSTRWGSCSRGGTLSFNWRLALVPEDICRYIVIHEICHRREMNHSARFWQLVTQQYPDYKAARKWLRQHRDELA